MIIIMHCKRQQENCREQIYQVLDHLYRLFRGSFLTDKFIPEHCTGYKCEMRSSVHNADEGPQCCCLHIPGAYVSGLLQRWEAYDSQLYRVLMTKWWQIYADQAFHSFWPICSPASWVKILQGAILPQAIISKPVSYTEWHLADGATGLVISCKGHFGILALTR